MAVISTVSRVPADQIQNYKYRNIKHHIVDHLKSFIIIQETCGMNRLWLLDYKNSGVKLLNLYSIFLISIIFYFILITQYETVTLYILRNTFSIEYILLVLQTTLMSHKDLKSYFENLTIFDKNFKLENHLDVVIFRKRIYVYMTAFASFTFVELVVYSTVLGGTFDFFSYFAYCLVALAHDFEQIFNLSVLRLVNTRVNLIRAYVEAMYLVRGAYPEKPSKIDLLAKRCRFDATSLRQAYVMLHQCSEQVNSAINLPMSLMYFSNTMVTIFLLKAMTHDDMGKLKQEYLVPFIVYGVVKIVKLSYLIWTSCFISSDNMRQVTVMYNILHNVMYSMDIDKTEYRRIKSFFLEVKERSFGYALFNVLELDQSLPLNYCSFCITYLVIIIQVSDFVKSGE